MLSTITNKSRNYAIATCSILTFNRIIIRLLLSFSSMIHVLRLNKHRHKTGTNLLQTMIRRHMDRNRPTIGLFAGQIPCYKRYTIADHLYGR